MPELFLTSGPNMGKSFKVGLGATIGRSPECTVRLAHKSISRQHAHLDQRDGRWVLVDDGSRNGIFSGRERLERIELADGDEFRVGELFLRFRAIEVAEEQEEAAPPVDDDYEEEISLEGDAATEIAPEIVIGGGAGEAGAAQEPAPKPARPAPRSRGAAGSARERQAAELAATQVARRPDDTVQARGATGRVLAYNRIENRPGFFSADLSQYPWWVKLPVVVLVLALAAGGAWLAFQGTGILFGTPDEALVDEP